MLCQLLLLPLLCLPSSTSSSSHLAVIDAGSSHTTVVLYRWDPATAPREVSSCYNGDDGIAQFADRPELVEPYLLPCIDQVAETLAEEDLLATHIVLGATSGRQAANCTQSGPI